VSLTEASYDSWSTTIISEDEGVELCSCNLAAYNLFSVALSQEKCFTLRSHKRSPFQYILFSLFCSV
jgi:hypothetical protein